MSNPAGVTIRVIPSELEFSLVGQSLSYKITFAGVTDSILGSRYSFWFYYIE